MVKSLPWHSYTIIWCTDSLTGSQGVSHDSAVKMWVYDVSIHYYGIPGGGQDYGGSLTNASWVLKVCNLRRWACPIGNEFWFMGFSM